MSSNKVRVAGYSQKVFYNNNIEYRPFSQDLVGLQLTNDGNTSLFTMGNFSITSNFEPKNSKNFLTKSFSKFINLSDMNLSLQSTIDLLINNSGVILNLDKKDLTNYALFGSFKEYVRVALENIITNWPAALYIAPVYAIPPIYLTQTGTTFDDYTYDIIKDTATFNVSTNVINNNYQVNYDVNGTLQGTFNSSNNLRNLSLNYLSYVVSIDNTEYDIIGFTGSTNGTIYLNVKGNPFNGSGVYKSYFIKPNKVNENKFYNSLPNFEYYLLNRLSNPKFTSTFNFTIKSDDGGILYVNEKLTWPTSDGYNIDFDTDQYAEFASKLLDISTNFDLTTSNLIGRFLVSESITDFDSTTTHLDELDKDTSAQKMNKTLNLYGVEFDKINTFIKGLQFVNVVSYDKENNTPDIYLKNIARILGWDLVSSVLENNLLKEYLTPSNTKYSGHSVGLTAVEADIELWRRLILNTPWLWKSKGTRKAIEFMFRFIGTPLGLITFNEYIYLAENKIDLDIFKKALSLNNNQTDITEFPIDNDGYPSPLPNTSDIYFQGNGLWYRETGGSNASIDITTGNNPHSGEYDGGYKYLNQFRELIPNFSSVTISSQTTTTSTDNLFTNYHNGTINTYTGDTYVDVTTNNGIDFSDCFVVDSTIVLDPKKRKDESDCGCQSPNDLKSLSLCIEKKNIIPNNCKDDIALQTFDPTDGKYTFSYNQYNLDGSLYTINGNPVYNVSDFVAKDCCNFMEYKPYYYEEFSGDGTASSPFIPVNYGYICCIKNNNRCGCLVTCKWLLDTPRYITINSKNYLQFRTPAGDTKVTSPDGCNCIAGYTVPVEITASTTDIGYGCQLTDSGMLDINLNKSIIEYNYTQRVSGGLGCYETDTQPIIPNIFGVVINSSEQIGGRINNLEYFDTTSQTFIGRNFNNSTTPLVGTTGSVNIGYYYGFSATQGFLPNSGDMVKMLISAEPNINVNLGFNTTLGHKMYYLISDVEYNSTTFTSQVFNGLNEIPVKFENINGTDYWSAEFKYLPTGTQTYIYMIWDFVPRQTTSTCQLTATIEVADGVATAIPSNGTAPYKYSWSTGTPPNYFSRDQSITNLGNAVYNVTITDGKKCVAKATIDLTTPPPPPLKVYEGWVAFGDSQSSACGGGSFRNVRVLYSTTDEGAIHLVNGQTYYNSDGTPASSMGYVSDFCKYGILNSNGQFISNGRCPNANC